MKKDWMLGIALIAIFAFGGASQAQEGATWTFMVYIAGDNDLESFIMNDLMEMQAVGSNDSVRIVVQVDRAEGYDEVNGNWTGARRYLIEGASGPVSLGDFQIQAEGVADIFRQISPADLGMNQGEFDGLIQEILTTSQGELESFYLQNLAVPAGGEAPTIGLQQSALEDLGEINQADPASLVDFALWAMANFPADNYGLVMWDHGGGWTGFGGDEGEPDHDSMDMQEIDLALSAIRAQTGLEKFEFVAFDACLMSQVEVFQMLAPHAHYTITAQEVIPGAGWEYATPLKALRDNPDWGVLEFGQVVVDSYITFYSEVVTDYPGFDLNVVDLSQTDALLLALDAFSASIQANPAENLRAVGQARNNVQVFGNSAPDAAAYISSVDVVNFMELFIRLSPDEGAKVAAQEVIAASRNMIAYGQANEGLPGANGVAVYFPATSKDFALGENDKRYAAELPLMAEWNAFLNTFHGTAIETFAAEDLNILIKDVVLSADTANIYDPPVVLFDMEGQGIVDLTFVATLVVDEGVGIILDQSPLVFTVFDLDGNEITGFDDGLTVGEFQWNVEAPVLTDGTEEVFVVLISEASSSEAYVSGIYYRRDGKSQEAFLGIDLETRAVTSVFGVDQNGAIAEIKVTPGDQFEPTWRFIDETGEETIYPSEIYLTFGRQPFTFSYQPAPSGDYVLSMVVEDMAGNISLDAVQFSIDNEGLDPAYRGFKDLSFGINFLYPWGWSDPSITQIDDETYQLVVSSPEGDISIFVDAYAVQDAEELYNLSVDTLTSFDATLYDVEEFEIQGYAAALLPYEYEGETGGRIGLHVLVYRDDIGLGYIIDLDSSLEAEEAASAVFDVLINSLAFFDPIIQED